MVFIVLGGGCYGTFYTRQLMRAADAGAMPRPEIVVVDHNTQPQVLRELGADARVRLVRQDWEPFFEDYFSTLSAAASDQIVPPPFTPHLAVSWLLKTVRAARPDVHWDVEPFRRLPATPFERQSDNCTLVASHADWICPVHCIEPAICPKTRGPRDWDMADTARAFARELGTVGQPVDQVHLLQCLHLTHGVGTYSAAALLQARAAMQSAAITTGSTLRVLVGTVSHCHGAMHLISGRLGTDTVSRPGTSAIRADATISRGSIYK
jgi:hypothetical protein